MAAHRSRAAQLFAALLALTAAPGSCVRLKQREGSSAEADDGHSDDAGVQTVRSEEGSCAEAAPDIAQFERRWWNFMRSEVALAREVSEKGTSGPQGAVGAPRGSAEALGKGSAGMPIRLLVGVFSRAGCKDRPFRNITRSTWMQQPGVCTLSNSSPSGDCDVYVTHVVGNDSSQSEEDDLTVLPIKENMNKGKTRVWFQHAAEHFEWATHIMKMDIDAFPHVSRIVSAIRQFSSPCQHVFGGVSWNCAWESYCPNVRCGRPVGDNFLKYNTTVAGCFSYMQGGFYFMTRELAGGITRPGGFMERDIAKNCHPEDVTTGRAIKKYADQQKICVSALKFAKDEGAWHRYKDREWRGCAESEEEVVPSPRGKGRAVGKHRPSPPARRHGK